MSINLVFFFLNLKFFKLTRFILHSAYGFTLLKYDSTSYKSLIVRSRRNIKTLRTDKYESFGFKIRGAPDFVLLQQKRKYTYTHNLCEIGSTILWQSKFIFFNSIYHILSHANPTKLSIAYQDTDSIHLLMNGDNIEECIWPELLTSWNEKYDNFFGTNKKISGTLIVENCVEYAHYRGEKCYSLGENVHFKSIPNRYHYLITPTVNYGDQITYASINKNDLYGVVFCNISKIVKSLIVPKKRYFVSEKYSTPLDLNK